MLITQTPLRISLAGGGTDLPAYYRQVRPGAVLSSAIDKYVYVILNKRFDDKIYISYSRKEIVESIDEIQHELIRESLRMAGVTKGVEIAIMADIPSSGSGLGSSSSLTVGLLNAFYTYRGILVTAEQLAREACAIEIDRCGKPIGKQDQYIAAYGGMRFFEFMPDETVRVSDPLPPDLRRNLGARLILHFTNMTRQADTILKEQSAQSVNRSGRLDAIRDLAFATRDAVMAGRHDEIGAILNRNWEEKKALANGISNPGIEEMVSRALAGGGIGCKICGAGGGGFLMTYVPPARLESFRAAMSLYREMPFFLERCGSKVIFNTESYEWH